MNEDQPSKRGQLADAVAVLARWVLGVLFVYMGLKKALNPRGNCESALASRAEGNRMAR